jgi:hypothetical protein
MPVYDLTADGKKRRYVGEVRPWVGYTASGAWSSSVYYKIGDPCTSGGHTYLSLIEPNLNNAVGVTTAWQDIGASPGDSRGVFANTKSKKLILSANPTQAAMGVINYLTTTTSQSVSGTSWAKWQATDAWTLNILSDGVHPIDLSLFVKINGGYLVAAFGVDATTPDPDSSTTYSQLDSPTGRLSKVLPFGYHVIYALVATAANGASGTAYYWVQDAAQPICKAAINGTCWV